MLAFAAIIVDRNFRIVGMTSAAEYILKTREFLTVRQNRVEGIVHNDTLKIAEAFKRFMTPGHETDRSETVAITGTRGSIAHVRLTPLVPSGGGADIGVALLSIEPLDASALALSRLTAAETEVAVALIAGGRATEIACQRRVSVETVRSQIKSIYAKFDVKGHVELIAALRREQ